MWIKPGPRIRVREMGRSVVNRLLNVSFGIGIRLLIRVDFHAILTGFSTVFEPGF